MYFDDPYYMLADFEEALIKKVFIGWGFYLDRLAFEYRQSITAEELDRIFNYIIQYDFITGIHFDHFKARSFLIPCFKDDIIKDRLQKFLENNTNLPLAV